MTIKTVSVLAAVALAFGLPAEAAPSHDDRVRTQEGWVRGTVTAEHRSFQGIPYAAPPIRWRAPRPADPWQGERDATQPRQACAQIGREGLIGGEDCLFVNVTTPRTITGPLPVMVFVHGGGLVNGWGAAYDPKRMVKQNAIVVTFNYRLGALGFLKHPALDDPYAGNFGLADQQAALRWVRKNIAAFGGDQRNVTLWGQSGGGVSVCSQLASPSARGLFDKAIVQSAPCGNDVLDRQTATDRGRAFATDVGCETDTERCLRDTPVERLIRPADSEQTFKAHRRAADKPWMPVAGTTLLPLQPLTALKFGTAADVPLLHGGTKHEMRAHVSVSYPTLTATNYPETVQQLFGPEADRILAEYPVTAYETPGSALGTMLTDYGAMVGACTQLPAIDAATRGAPVYAFEYAQPSHQYPELGAYHGTDLEYLIDRMPPSFTEEQNAFAERLIGYWTSFARTGAPGPRWPEYRRGSATVMSLAIDDTGPVDLAGEHRCGFWRSVR
ncbi:carboxylesterase/lipase family protein [Kibdelosporangium persicum]|uniref:Carboxylic ester hydrolase n=1 Tax=Kibdelosporangium persicum TaxID=2698649 RepID=A0ABX2EVN0_9PSEU|nr:carboxylesterase family protein [Kibdelosporangium persicum]NRN62818.1 Carboxylic ester hydrolase [Kibdelosporangium persicum]